MDKKSLHYELAKIYAEEKLRQHNMQLYDKEGCFESYDRNIDLLLNFTEEAQNGFALFEENREKLP